MIRVSTFLVLLSPTRLELPFLQDAKKFDLQLGRRAVDLVKKDAAGVCRFKPTSAIIYGAGERAFNVAKKLAFEQAFRQAPQLTRIYGPVERGLRS